MPKMRPIVIDSDETHDATQSPSRESSTSRGSGQRSKNASSDKADPESDDGSNHGDSENEEPDESGESNDESGEDCDENSDEDSDEDESGDEETRTKRNTRREKFKSAARFFAMSASEDDGDNSDSNESRDFNEYGDDIDSDGNPQQRGPFDRFFNAMNWAYDSDEGPWETLESQRELSPSLERLYTKHAAISKPASTLRITWTGNRRLKNQSFTGFMRLPTELRLQIWELAFEEVSGEPRVLPIHVVALDFRHLLPAPSLSTFTSGQRVFMAINRETRAIGKAKFPKKLPIDGEGTLWFNPSRDIILATLSRGNMFHVDYVPLLGVTDIIENLAFRPWSLPSIQPWNWKWVFDFLNMFSRLKNVFLESEVIRNPMGVSKWMQSDQAVTIRNIMVEATEIGEKMPYAQIMSFPNVWRHADTFGSEVIGSGSGPFKVAFKEFVDLAKKHGDPSVFHSPVHWETLANVNFWPLIEVKDMKWPPSMYLERRHGTQFGESCVDIPMYSQHFNRRAIIQQIGANPADFSDEEESNDDDNDPVDVENMHPEDVDDPLMPEYISEADEDVVMPTYYSESNGGHGSPSAVHGTVAMDSEGNLVHGPGAGSDSDDNEDHYESDFVVEDDEVEFADDAGDDILDDDIEVSSDDEGRWRRRRGQGHVLVISSDENEDNGDSHAASSRKRSHSTANDSDDSSDTADEAPRPQKHRRVQPPPTTGYRGVSSYVVQGSSSTKPVAVESDSDEDDVPVQRQSRRRWVVDDDDSDEDDQEGSGRGSTEESAAGGSGEKMSSKARGKQPRRVLDSDDDE